MHILYTDDREDRGLATLADPATIEPVRSAEDAYEALGGQDIDCVVSAPTVGGVDAVDLLDSLREAGHQVPFVLLGDAVPSNTVRELLARERTDYLPRVSADDDGVVLRNRIERLLGADRASPTTQSFYEAVIEAAPAAIVAFDPTEDLSLWNPAASRITGWSSDAIDENPYRMLADQFEADAKSIYDDVEPGNPVFGAETKLARPSGETFPVAVSLASLAEAEMDVAGTVAVLQDITERQDRERRLETFRRAVENASHAITILDDEMNVEYVNPAFEEMTGYDADAVVGNAPPDIAVENTSYEEVDERWSKALDGTAWRGEFVARKQSGERFHVAETINPVLDDDGSADRLVALKADITMAGQRRQQIAVLNRVLRHDFRNDLNLVLLKCEQLKEHLPAENYHLVDEIVDDIHETLGMAEKVQKAEKMFEEKTIELQSIDLNRLLHSKAASLNEEHLSLELSIDVPEDVAVYGTNLLGVAIDNVLQNAIEHNDSADPKAEIEVVSRKADREVDIHIRDNGPGIPVSEVAVLDSGDEDPLHHLSGLGLWLVHWIITLSGGEMQIGENKPRGTTVTLTLPLAGEGQAEISNEVPNAHT
jgi:PAS domain S-box-containing protein